MLIGKMDKAFAPSVHYPATDSSKPRRQDRGEHCGEDRGDIMGMMVAVTFAAVAYQRVAEKGCRSILGLSLFLSLILSFIEPHPGSPGGSNPEASAPSSFCFDKCLVK